MASRDPHARPIADLTTRSRPLRRTPLPDASLRRARRQPRGCRPGGRVPCRARTVGSRSRAMRTAELAGLVGVRPDPDLLEWDYGGYEGLTSAQIQEMKPGWDLWRDGVIPGDDDHPGEQLQQVAARTDAVLGRIRPLLEDGDVAVVAHGHLARVLTVRWLGLDASASRLLGHPHPGTLSFLATEDGQPFIAAWNVP
ncbi:histidine phosphatase family protein [Streptomyces sp. NPDC003487]